MKYRVVHARLRRREGKELETYHPGDTIEATESELSAFSDNLEAVEESNDELTVSEDEDDEEICGTKMSDGSICERLVDECSYHESE